MSLDAPVRRPNGDPPVGQGFELARLAASRLGLTSTSRRGEIDGVLYYLPSHSTGDCQARIT